MINSTELVEIIRNDVVTNSLVIAERTDNEHRAILQLIGNHEERLARWGKVEFRISNAEIKSDEFGITNAEIKKRSNRGRPTRVAYLNEQQATFLVTLLRNNDIVLDFKAELVDQFYKMRELLRMQRDPQWQEIRAEVKQTFRKLTDAIRDFIIPLARKNGSVTPDDKFYMNWANMLCKIGCYNPRSRDKLSLGQLFILDQLQDIAVAEIRGLIRANLLDHKAIRRQVKLKLEGFSRIALITERFGRKELPA